MNDDQLKSIMAKVFKTNAGEISTLTSQKNLDSWDSLAHLNLIVELEMELDIDFDPEEISQINSFVTLKELLKLKLG